MEIKTTITPREQEFDSRGNPIIDAEFYDIVEEDLSSTKSSPEQKLPKGDLTEDLVDTKPTDSNNLTALTNAPREFIGERADMAEKIHATENQMAEEYKSLKLEASEVEKIEEALADVSSGEKDEVTIYIEDKRAEVAYLSGRYGEEKSLKKAEAELVAAEKKEVSVLQVREASEFAKQKLEDPTLDEATKAKLEKNKMALEKIALRLEKKRQSQDRGFAEKKLDWAKENIAGRWLKAKWYNKVAVGATLSTLTLGASQFITRPLGLYASYQGLKEGKISKLTNAISKLEDSDSSDEIKMLEIEKVILENNFDKKALLGALALSATFAGLGEYISNTETAATVINYISDKTSEGVSSIANIIPQLGGGETTEATVTANTSAEGTGAAVVGASSPEATATAIESASAVVASGETLYSILEREFDISNKLPQEGQQYNAIENILAQIKADPSSYGITSGDINKLSVGDNIDITKIESIISTHKIGDQGIFEHALGLPAAVISGIETYMPAEAKTAFESMAQHKIAAASLEVAKAASNSLDTNVSSITANASTEVNTGTPISDIAEPVAAGNAGAVTSVEQPTGTNSVVAETEKSPNSVTYEFENNKNSVVWEPIAINNLEITPVTSSVYASLNMTPVESTKIYTLLMADSTRLGVKWPDIVRFGTEPISTFLNQKPAGSEKVLSIIESYRAVNPIQPNDKTTVLQYLQHAALAKIRVNNIV